jgi:hypothetical protein
VDRHNATVAGTVPRLMATGNFEFRLANFYAITIGDRLGDVFLEKTCPLISFRMILPRF